MLLSSFAVGDGARSTLLLHGFLGSGKNLRAVALRWAAVDSARRFLLPDLTGHGDSSPLPADADLDSVARDVLLAAEAAGFSAPHAIVGHSLGGRVALAAARVAPEALADIVLLDIAPGPVDPARSQSRRVLDALLAAPDQAPDRRTFRADLMARGLSPALTDWVLMNLRNEGGVYRWRMDRRAMDVLHEGFNRDDLWPVVASRRVPIRCLRGELSPYVTDADASRMETAGCPVRTIPGAGHFLHVDALDRVLDDLTATTRFASAGP